ncbi:MAG TPA: hypothetical protein VJB70_04625 [Candidatus Paceibacterota bacterium]
MSRFEFWDDIPTTKPVSAQIELPFPRKTQVAKANDTCEQILQMEQDRVLRSITLWPF